MGNDSRNPWFTYLQKQQHKPNLSNRPYYSLTQDLKISGASLHQLLFAKNTTKCAFIRERQDELLLSVDRCHLGKTLLISWPQWSLSTCLVHSFATLCYMVSTELLYLCPRIIFDIMDRLNFGENSGGFVIRASAFLRIHTVSAPTVVQTWANTKRVISSAHIGCLWQVTCDTVIIPKC